jgi:hypothetical protein
MTASSSALMVPLSVLNFRACSKSVRASANLPSCRRAIPRRNSAFTCCGCNLRPTVLSLSASENLIIGLILDSALLSLILFHCDLLPFCLQIRHSTIDNINRILIVQFNRFCVVCNGLIVVLCLESFVALKLSIDIKQTFSVLAIFRPMEIEGSTYQFFFGNGSSFIIIGRTVFWNGCLSFDLHYPHRQLHQLYWLRT